MSIDQSRHPAFHARLGPGDASGWPAAMPGAPVLTCGPLRVWVRAELAAHGHLFVHMQGDNAAVVLGHVFDWPGQVPGANPAHLICRSLAGGAAVPRDLAGEFCALYWDGQTGTLTLLGDQAGTRPIHYHTRPDRIAVASDIESLLPFCSAPLPVHRAALRGYLGLKTDAPPDQPLAAELRKLAPGHVVRLRPGSSRVQRYWSPDDAPDIRHDSFAGYVEDGRARLRQAVSDRVAVQDRLAVHLTGGLDASAVTAIAVQVSRARGTELPVAYSWQPSVGDGPDTNDIRIREIAAAAFGLTPVACPAPGAGLEAFTGIDPVTLPATGETQMELPVMHRVRGDGVRYVLTGWGGDQALSFSGHAEVPLVRLRRMFRLLRRATRVTPDSYLAGETRLGALYTRYREACAPRTTDSARKSILAHGYLAQRMAAWSVLGALEGVQYGYPLCDRRVLDFALGVPPRLFRRKGVPRALMRGIVSGLVPDELRDNRDKTEPSRTDPIMAAFPGFAATVTQRLEAGKIDPGRAALIDMARLRHDLDRAARGEKVPYARILLATAFLFGETPVE